MTKAINQTSKKTDFTADLLWWGLLRLAPINDQSKSAN